MWGHIQFNSTKSISFSQHNIEKIQVFGKNERESLLYLTKPSIILSNISHISML